MELMIRLNILFSEDELNRINIVPNINLTKLMIVDVHGLKTFEAKRFINNLINITQTDFNLVVIHGYNHGTAIKNMLETDFANPHVKNQYVDINNPGRTYLYVA